MKKLMFTLLVALLGLTAMDASALFGSKRRSARRSSRTYSNHSVRNHGDSCGCDRCGSSCRGGCERSCEPVCEPVCAKQCKVDFVEEERCPEAPCCVRYVRVEEPALVTKHVSYSLKCPTGCTKEQKDAGMMKAGETWETGKATNDKGSY